MSLCQIGGLPLQLNVQRITSSCSFSVAVGGVLVSGLFVSRIAGNGLVLFEIVLESFFLLLFLFVCVGVSWVVLVLVVVVRADQVLICLQL